MITADQTELITAAVDGELSATEVRIFRRLLDNSGEARALYAKLRADRDRVRNLPLATPPEPAPAYTAVHVAPLMFAGIVSATVAPVVKLGPLLLTTTV